MATQRTALVSVFDKTGVTGFCEALVDLGFRLLSTGGTARALRDAGVRVTDVSEVTGFPEILDGRVKTLHPRIHGGLLALRSNPEHMRTLERHGIDTIDLVAVNLYPFEQTIAKDGVTEEEAVENIDIGGPTMIRSAAKNFASVTVIVDPSDYAAVLFELRAHGDTLPATRRRLAAKVYAHTSRYDSAITRYLTEMAG
jgi:phosphoribosylaminoimidazolecarboxamide formyltransferase/IMP cyclohydrolase